VSYDYDDIDEARPRGPQSPAVQAALARGRGQRSGGSGGDHTQEAIASGKYTEVKVRVQEFYAKYPEGRIVTTKVKVYREMADGLDRVLVQALAYRTPDDPYPGRGTSWMVIPGTTPYTKNSEVENCETSAWGRAIAAVGVAIDKNIATAQEIRMKGGGEVEGDGQPTGPAQALAQAAAQAAGVPVNGEDAATEPEPDAPVEEAATPEPEEATETAAEPATAPEPVKPKRGQGKAKENAPDTRMPDQVIADNKAAGIVKEPDPTDVVTDGSDAAEAQVAAEVEKALTTEGEGLTYEDFVRIAREKFVPNGHIQSVARQLVEAGNLRSVGGVRELTDQERLTLLLAALAKMDDGGKK
jgi:hypothetical protein